MRKLVIDRKKWNRGPYTNERNPIQLRNHKGNMCCLGFYALYCGYSEGEITGIGEPWEAVQDLGVNKWPNWLIDMEEDEDGDVDVSDSCVSTELICINDELNCTEKEREDQIKGIFANHGVEVEFVG